MVLPHLYYHHVDDYVAKKAFGMNAGSFPIDKYTYRLYLFGFDDQIQLNDDFQGSHTDQLS